MGEYWMPKYKYEFVAWLTEHYWRVCGESWKARFQRKKKDELRAIYISIREKLEKESKPV